MTERNPTWQPIAAAQPDPVETVLRVMWSYQRRPVCIVWRRT